MIKELNVKYKLVKVLPCSNRYSSTLYEWNCNEKQRESFTCRPVKEKLNYDEYMIFMKNHIEKGVSFYVLECEDNDNCVIYGKITLFDYNPRNHSAEFGYYLPSHNREQGVGKILIQLFLDCVFNDKSLNLYKVYATTASGNIASIRILEYLNFNLDGRLRDHYWIGKDIQDQLHYSLLRKEWNNNLYVIELRK